MNAFTLPPRCCGTYADDENACSVCGERPVVPPNIVLAEN